MEGLKLKENEVVHCKTEKQANKVLKIAYKLGYEWQVQGLGNRFCDCKENTVYHLDNIITYSDLEYCKGKELKVITAKEFLKRHKETKKCKLTIIVSKNYKELYEDNLALVNHILLDTVRNDKEWVEKVQKSNLNITLYTDKNDPELFKKSFDKFEVKLMDSEECNNNLKGLVLVSHKGVDKSRLQEPEYVEQMIKEGKILHAENFNKSLVMDNGSTISNVKEGEAKSIEELHVEHRDNNSIGKSYNKKHLHLEEPVFNPQSHYNNEFGSLYKLSEQLGLNTYEFDILKRVVRCRKKGQFEEDLQKTKDLIDLYLIESKK